MSVEEFLTFMRAHGPSMHNLTNYSREKRGLEKKAAYRSPLLQQKASAKPRKSAMERLESFRSSSSRGLLFGGDAAPPGDDLEDDGLAPAPGPAAGAPKSPTSPLPEALAPGLETARRRGGRRAVQLAHLQWRRRVNEAKIREAIKAKSADAERDFIMRFATNRKGDQAHWRNAVIVDELHKPLAIDSELLNKYEKQAALTHVQEAAEARRHASSLIWLDRRIKQREEHILEDCELFGNRSSYLEQPSTLGLMKSSFVDLKAKIDRYGERRFGNEEWEALEALS